ncbi:MAG TPA: hypothetical protein VGC14_25175 [Rhizobium sp.]
MATHEEVLLSKPDYHTDPIEQLAFELAFELETAELDRNDYVTVNRDKLKAIATRVLSRSAWQDISTAPKDGTDLLLSAENWHGDVVVGCWSFGGWRDRDDGDALRPTHWQHIPSAPTPSEDKGDLA